MPSKDPTSESFRVPLSLPWMSRIQGAIRAVRRKIRTLFPGHRAPNLRLLSTSRVNLATFRAHRRRHFAKTSPQPSSGISEVRCELDRDVGPVPRDGLQNEVGLVREAANHEVPRLVGPHQKRSVERVLILTLIFRVRLLWREILENPHRLLFASF